MFARLRSFEPGCLAAILVLVSGCAGAGADDGTGAPATRLRLIDEPADEGFATVVVEGLSLEVRTALAAMPKEDPRWRSIVRVYTGAGPPHPDQPPLLGKNRLEHGLLRFRPRFPLVPGLSHFARFDGGLVGASEAELVFTLPRPSLVPRARVIAVHPAVDEVPANLLRVYVHFSEAMHPRDVLRHVRLLDVSGDEIVEPFLDFDDGLWDPGRTRLTLFFHPGRIKRGVGPNAALGPPLEPGARYELVIDAALEDASGMPLVASHAWSFRTLARDEESPDPTSWTIHGPVGADDPLEIDFGEPLDHALASRLILVENEAGNRLQGEGSTADGGARWTWRPAEPWADGGYTVVVHPSLEDLAGNAIGHRFEERFDDRAGGETASPVRLGFSFPAR